MSNGEVRIAPMLRRRIESVLGDEIRPEDESSVVHLEYLSSETIAKIKKIVEKEDQIMAEKYLKFLVTPENYPHVFGFLIEVIIDGQEKRAWIRDNIGSKSL